MIIKINLDVDHILESVVLLLVTQEEVLAHSNGVLYTLLSIMT